VARHAIARTHCKLAEVSEQAALTRAGKPDKSAKASAQLAPTTAKPNARTAKKTALNSSVNRLRLLFVAFLEILNSSRKISFLWGVHFSAQGHVVYMVVADPTP
jgi:hypothetical protein